MGAVSIFQKKSQECLTSQDCSHDATGLRPIPKHYYSWSVDLRSISAPATHSRKLQDTKKRGFPQLPQIRHVNEFGKKHSLCIRTHWGRKCHCSLQRGRTGSQVSSPCKTHCPCIETQRGKQSHSFRQQGTSDSR